MPSLHDSDFRATLRKRLDRITPQTPRTWGKMSPDQMLWHLNRGLENALGRFPVAPVKVPIPRPLLRFMVLNLPWGKGKAQTAPEFVATGSYDCAAERAKLGQLIDEFAARDVAGSWPASSFMGPMSGMDWSRLTAKHIDHHLKQFGV